LPYIKIKQLESGDTDYLNRDAYNPEENNSAIMIFCDIGKVKKDKTKNWDIKTLCLHLVDKFVQQKFFDELRTIEQLGYICNTSKGFIGSLEYPTFGYFYRIQSNVKNPEYLEIRINKFIENALDIINKIDVEILEKYKEILRDTFSIRDDNLSDEFSRNTSEIMKGDYMFERKEYLKDALNNIDVDMIKQFYKKYFINTNKRRMRIVKITSIKHK